MYFGYQANTTLVHRESGWVSAPDPAGMRIFDVSCASATFCGALGDASDGQDHFVRYDGSSWQVATPLPVSHGEYQGIACAAPTYCLAPGTCVDPTYCLAPGAKGSAEFDGASWTRTATVPAISVTSVECGAPGSCVALGRRLGRGAVFTGDQWIEAPLPDNGETGAGLSCPSATLCRATDGQGRTFDLAGSTWSTARQLVPATGLLRDISCASRVWCMAIDLNGNALVWHDRHWSKPKQIDPDHALIAISCAPDRTCAAVTSVLELSPGFQFHGRAFRYVHGEWQHPKLIDPSLGVGDVSCPSSGYCAAVDGLGRVITFTHGSWSAPAQTADTFLQTIDCVAPRHCVTVGHGGTLVLTGQSWHHVVAFGRHVDLTRIDCVDPAFCVAATSPRGLAELHAGVWAQLSVENLIVGPSCASRTLCIGDALSAGGVRVDETFDGSAGRQSRYHREKAVTCVGDSMCIELTNNSALVGNA
jgi:hypothetical protein